MKTSAEMNAFIKSYRTQSGARRARILMQFTQTLRRPLRIMDLGGTASMWQRWGLSESDEFRITLVNSDEIDKSQPRPVVPTQYMDEVQENVLNLSSRDFQPYDLIFSNSLLEHLPSRDEQAQLAAAIAGSGRPYFIQVPNKYCIIDPHFPHPFAAFFATLPRHVRARMLTLHRLGSSRRCQTYAEAMERMRYYNPLGRADMEALFPKAAIQVERMAGLPMSILAMHK
jgi:hypothetical protein